MLQAEEIEVVAVGAREAAGVASTRLRFLDSLGCGSGLEKYAHVRYVPAALSVRTRTRASTTSGMGMVAVGPARMMSDAPLCKMDQRCSSMASQASLTRAVAALVLLSSAK